MKRRLILHLGLSRTGTTSIQSFFRQNPEALAAAGVAYPKIGAGVPNHAAFQRTALTSHLSDEINHVALALEIHRPDHDANGADLDTPFWSRAFRQIDDSGAHTAIVSYENFSVNVEKYRFSALKKEFSDFDVVGFIYLRKQEHWAPSLYGHKILGKQRFTVPFRRFVRSLRRRLDYSFVLDAVAHHIPLERLIVGDFEEAARSGLIGDFLDRADLARGPLVSTGEKSARNASFPPWAILFLLRCNQAGLPDVAFLHARAALGRQTTREADFGLRPGLDIATPDEREALRKSTAADAGRLAEKYGVTLSAETREPAAYRPFDEEDFRAIKAAIAPQLTTSTLEALDNL